jgi:hypothetical protein
MISKAFSGFSRRAVRIFSQSVMRVPYVQSLRHSAKIGPNCRWVTPGAAAVQRWLKYPSTAAGAYSLGSARSARYPRPYSRTFLGTLIKSKNPWNDQPENASQSKVTWRTASLGSGPSPHDNAAAPRLGSRYRRSRRVGSSLRAKPSPVSVCADRKGLARFWKVLSIHGTSRDR